MFYFCHLVGNFRRKQLLPWSQQLKDRRVRKFKILGVFSLWCQDGDYISSIESSHQGQDLKDIPPSSPKSAPFRELSRKPHWTFSTYMSWATPLQRKMGSVPFFFFFDKLGNCHLPKHWGFVSEEERKNRFWIFISSLCPDLHDPSFLFVPVMQN